MHEADPNPSDAMPIRPAEPADIPDIAALWCRAFPTSRSYASRVRQLETGGPYGGLESVWLLEEERLLGACKLYALTQYITGRPLPMMGLAAVGVEPDARRRGVGARLCREAIVIGRERGDLLSALFPFRAAFYERLGWGLFAALHEHLFDPGDLPEHDGADAVRLAGPADLAAIADCYDRVASEATGPIRRDEAIWRSRIGDDEIGVNPPDTGTRDPHGLHYALVHDDGGVRGYLLVRAGREKRQSRRTLHIREMVARDESSLRGLLGWIARQRDQWPLVRYEARPDERFADRLREPGSMQGGPTRPLWFESARLLRGPMIRVLDVPGALRARAWWTAGSRPEREAVMTLWLEVDDPDVEENRGPWRVALSPDGARVERTDTEKGEDARLSTHVATFSRIFAGEIRPTEAARLGRADAAGDVAGLDAAFATRRAPWLFDHF